jgi:hypothetical protein
LRPIQTRWPIHFYLIAVRVLKVNAHGVAVTYDPDHGYVVLQKKLVKLFDIGEAGTTERNLLHYFAILSAWHEQQFVVLFLSFLCRHERAAGLGILVANLQAKNIAIEFFGTLDVAYVKAT